MLITTLFWLTLLLTKDDYYENIITKNLAIALNFKWITTAI